MKERWGVSNLSGTSALSSEEQEGLHEHTVSVTVETLGSQ